MNIVNRLDWDELFMRQVYLYASRSRDIRTRVGAVIVADGNDPIASAYNGLPRQISYESNPNWLKNPDKNFVFCHAETNAVALCASRGRSTAGSVLYCQGIPCNKCAQTVIQAGIKEVIVHTPWNDLYKNQPNWSDSVKYSEKMFEYSGVKTSYFDKNLGIECLLGGEVCLV